MGHIQGAHGLKGELLVYLPSGDSSWLSRLKIVVLKNPNEIIKENQNLGRPFQVLKANPFKAGLRLLLEGISDRTTAEKLRGWELYIEKDLLISKPGEVIYLSEILGFQVLQCQEKQYQEKQCKENNELNDSEGTLSVEILGSIVGFSSNGNQDLLQIKNSRGTFEAPFVAAFIVRIDFAGRRLIVRFPPGLQDID